MEYLVHGKELTKGDLTRIHGGLTYCLQIYCGSDSGCGEWSKCIGTTTYYGCTGINNLAKPDKSVSKP